MCPPSSHCRRRLCCPNRYKNLHSFARSNEPKLHKWKRNATAPFCAFLPRATCSAVGGCPRSADSLFANLAPNLVICLGDLWWAFTLHRPLWNWAGLGLIIHSNAKTSSSELRIFDNCEIPILSLWYMNTGGNVWARSATLYTDSYFFIQQPHRDPHLKFIMDMDYWL